MQTTIRLQIEKIIENFNILNDKKYYDKIISASNIIITTLKKKKKVIFLGNGGSASDAEHLSAELLGRYLKNRNPFASLSITSNTASLTAISNDFGYDQSFSRQIKGIASKGDTVFAISTSMRSKNVINAINESIKIGCKTIILASEISNKNLSRKVDLFIDCPGKRVDRIQEVQIAVGHMICGIVEENLK